MTEKEKDILRQNEDYWAERFITLNEELHKDVTEKYLQIDYAFQQAQWEIQNDIEKWYNRIAINNNLSQKGAVALLNDNQLAEFHWNVQEYIKYGKDNVTSQAWNKQLENSSAKYHITRLEALKTSTQNALEKAFGNQLDITDTMARDTFTSGSYKTMYELQKGLNIGFDVAKINEGKLQNIISKPWAGDGRNFSSRIWGDKAKMITGLHSELTKQCITGKSNTKAINHMMNYVDTNVKNAKFCAKRLIVTEKAYFSSLSRFESFENLNVKQYKISAVFDLKTSQICRDMDGKIFNIDEYAIGKTAPPFHPFCRTDSVPYIDNKYTQNDIKKAIGENGEIQKIPANMSYREWEKTFLKDTVDDVGEEIKDNVQLSLESLTTNNSKTTKKELTSDTSSDIINSNNISGALNPTSRRSEEHAIQYYESVRNRTGDIETIAERINVDIGIVEIAKNHLFMTKHELDNDVYDYFYPDYYIAQSWQRLSTNNVDLQPQDIILVLHEHLEAYYMAQGYTQREAHDKANEIYNYQKVLNESRE